MGFDVGVGACAPAVHVARQGSLLATRRKPRHFDVSDLTPDKACPDVVVSGQRCELAADPFPGYEASGHVASEAEIRVFLSYRRADARAIARAIRQELVAKLTADRVFFDIDSIPVGVDFPTHLEAQL